MPYSTKMIVVNPSSCFFRLGPHFGEFFGVFVLDMTSLQLVEDDHLLIMVV